MNRVHPGDRKQARAEQKEEETLGDELLSVEIDMKLNETLEGQDSSSQPSHSWNSLARTRCTVRELWLEAKL